jgi:Pregnancy-associated plasma protein-A/PKD domain
MQHFYATRPEYNQLNDQVEKLLSEYKQKIRSGQLQAQRVNGIVTLPVAVHIIHSNGAENISDAQVFQGIQHLNEAFANTGYYDPADGVNTQIQFCMAQRDPSNNPTNGITRDVSPYTVMGGASYYSDDLNVKNINRWNPLCYINIWLVKSIPTSVVGYAYLPSAHGSNVDGIIEEAAYFGSSNVNDVVIIHEMGHYLGLYHTFEGGCTNNDCTNDGDKVCDTPPDQSTAGISCSSTVNSCTTDMLSGFATDQNDLTQDYMDYGNFNCMKVFTQGQSDRMNWFIQNVRMSLLACKSCMVPCPAPVTANFTSPGPPFNAGSSYLFTNTSVNAASYEWYVNGVLQSTAVNFNYTFPAVGSYTIKLIAKSGNPLCDDETTSITINAICGVMAGFTKSAAIAAAGTNINFTNTSTGATNYEWFVNGISQSTATNFSYTSATAGKYIIKLVARNNIANCQQEYIDTVEYTCSVLADFTPLSNTVIINTPVTFTSTGTGATTYQWLVNGIAAGSGPALTYTFTVIGSFTIQLIAGNGTCYATKYGFVYTTDKCGNAQYLFQKNYAAGLNSSANDIRATNDGGSILAERIVTTGNTNFDAAILKLDAGGNVQWMNRYSKNAGSDFKKIKPTSDGGYIAIGTISSPASSSGAGKIFIVKTFSTGAIAWSREFSPGDGADAKGTDIIQSADGNYYFTGSTLSPGAITGGTDAVAGQLDAAGNIVWVKTYDARSSEEALGLAEDNPQLIVCGNKSGQVAASGFLLKLNKADGSVVWSKTYQSTDENFNAVMVIPRWLLY